MDSLPILLSAVAAGGLIGAADQYLAVLLLSGASRLGLVTLPAQLAFMEHPVFIGVVVVFWIITVAPAYSTVIAPGIMNVINTVANFISGFVVPLSAALVSLAALGIIIDLHPDLALALEAINIFSGGGGENVLAPMALLVAGGGALTATTLTGAKALAKPAISTATGTLGSVSAPIYATIENVASVVLMGLLYMLVQTDPRLLIGLLAVVGIAMFIVLAFALYQLWRLKKGIGRMLHLAQTQPRAGLALVAEVFVWGSGWIGWKMSSRGVLMVVLWLIWAATLFIGIPGIATTMAAFFPPLIILGIGMFSTVAILGLSIGVWSSRALLVALERDGLIVEDVVAGITPA